jgi:diketogulonate reductase-like aldo/keto reductase
LRSALELGYVHFDTAEMYAAGHGEELLALALRQAGIHRDRVFITSKVLPDHLDYAEVLTACEGSLRRLGTDYIDLYLIHWPSSSMRLDETFRALNKTIDDGKVRHLGVSNFDRELLEQARKLSASPILTNQVPYSWSDRSYARNGILAYCQANDIALTAYSPLDVGRLRSNRALTEIARARSATPHQIALAWLCSQSRVIAIPMSRDPHHQRENLGAADILLSQAEMDRLD